MKMVILDGYTVNPGDMNWDSISQLGDTTIYEFTAPEETVAHIADAQIVLTNKVIIDKAVLDACPQIRLICVLATGYNVVDTAEAARRNIPVCNVPCYGTDSVAQFTFALLLELCHHVGYHSETVHNGKWVRSPSFCYWDTPQMELSGKTMGIIGFGRIGRAVGRLARAFGMNVLAYSRSHTEEGTQIGTYVDLDTLLSRSDVISLHCALTPETKGIINAESISRMKDGAMLINTARGPLVEEQALADALCSRKLAGAALDVVCQEPMAADCPFMGIPNCILTPHIAWSPLESRQRLMNCTAENIRGYLSGSPVNVVNL